MAHAITLPAPKSPTATRYVGRSIGAVIAGLVTVVVPSIGTDAVMHATGVFPAAGQTMSGALFALALGYRSLYAVLGGYVTARFAPQNPVKHALTLGAIGFVLSVLGTIAACSNGPEMGPLWYPLALVVSSVPLAWLGAKVHVARA